MRSNETDTEYVRVHIAGTLECVSDLHVGDGELAIFRERSGRAGSAQGAYNTVGIDANGNCYLPASTLRGFLRAGARGNPLLCEKLFGTLKNSTGFSGAVRVSDAYLDRGVTGTEANRPYWHHIRGTTVRHGIAIDPATGVAERRKLFRHELVPAASRFRLSVEADRIRPQELKALLDLLARWNGGERASIGKGKSKGQGRVRWEIEDVLVLTREKLLDWLRSDDSLDHRFLESVPLPKRPNVSERGVVLRLCPSAPLLSNEAGFVQEPRDEEDHPPQLEYSRLPDGRPFIPAASLRGLARARARRILATIAYYHQDQALSSTNAGKVADSLLDSLFGTTGQRSAFWFSDAVSETRGSPHPQFFNAVDRFTGGVAKEKLYNVNAVLSGELRFTVSIDALSEGRLREEDWWKGLLVLLLRDAMEGDLAIGWGKSRGYGAFRLKITAESGANIDAWAACLRELRRRCSPEEWIGALHAKIGQGVQDLVGGQTRQGEHSEARL
jgi:CRISPR/Cas system CSM-associated protein Csm3 (group 7 of RAMP superfamily)